MIGAASDHDELTTVCNAFRARLDSFASGLAAAFAEVDRRRAAFNDVSVKLAAVRDQISLTFLAASGRGPGGMRVSKRNRVRK